MRGLWRKLILIFLAVMIFIVTCFFITVKIPYKKTVYEFCESYFVEPAWVYAVMRAESGFKERAVSGAGAIGLMQIMPSTADWINGEPLTLEELYKPEKNIETGVRYLSYLKGEFSELWQILAAYNAGETRAKEWIENGIDKQSVPYSETRNYIEKVEGFIELYTFRLLWIK